MTDVQAVVRQPVDSDLDFDNAREGTEVMVFAHQEPRSVVLDEALLERYSSYRGLVLDEFQRQAICAIDQGFSVLVAAPTGSGKTVVADFIIEKLAREGRRAVHCSNQDIEHAEIQGVQEPDWRNKRRCPDWRRCHKP